MTARPDTPQPAAKNRSLFGADALKKLFGFGRFRPNLSTAENALGPERGRAEESLGATLFERFGPLLPHLTMDDEGFVVLEAARPGEYEGLGFALGFRPQTGMTEAIRKGLEGLVLAALPLGSTVAVTLFADPDVEDALTLFEESRLSKTQRLDPAVREVLGTMTKERATLQETLDAIVVEAYQSVARTPDLLPVLKENGVVDSGAFGFSIFIENFVAAVLGRETAAPEIAATFESTGDAKDEALSRVRIEANDDWEGSEYRYCNEFLFKAEKPFDEDEALAHLATLGDCELVVGAYPDFKVHVHSNEPNRVLEYMLQFGQVYEVFIHNMDMESHDRTAKIHADEDAAAEEAAAPAKPLGFVAVAAGSGEADILKSLGVDVVVSGGQTMNPSTADLLSAVEQVNAESVVILPNNSNIRMAAEAAASACSDRRVVVLPTRSVPQAFSALFSVMPDSELDDVIDDMREAIASVRDGEVTHAVRDSAAADGSPIHDGDVMGIICDSIEVVGSDVAEVTLECIRRMQEEEEGDSCTILAGADMPDDEFEKIVDAIEDENPDLEVDAHRGEQPLYPIIFSIE